MDTLNTICDLTSTHIVNEKKHAACYNVRMSQKTIYEEIGLRIKTLREGMNISQRELAERCGWDSQSRVGNYELGTRKVNADDAISLSKALGVAPSELMFGEGKNASSHQENSVVLTAEQEELLRAFNTLPKAEADRILAEVKTRSTHYLAMYEEMHKKLHGKAS